MKNTILISMICLMLGCSDDNGTTYSTPEDLLIRDNEISGWTRAGNYWTASSENELNDEINGEAVIYTQRGFVEAALQEYEGTILSSSSTITLKIFDQGDETNAKSVYDEWVNQMSSPIDWPSGAGEEAKIERFSTSQRLLFYDTKYYVSLSMNDGSDEALSVLKTFASNIDAKIE